VREDTKLAVGVAVCALIWDWLSPSYGSAVGELRLVDRLNGPLKWSSRGRWRRGDGALCLTHSLLPDLTQLLDVCW